jgi:hypothetical protein
VNLRDLHLLLEVFLHRFIQLARPSTGNLKGTTPATIIKSDCHGPSGKTSVPNQAISKREAGVPSISMAQPAGPKVGGHRADGHARLPTKSTNVAVLFSWYRL